MRLQSQTREADRRLLRPLPGHWCGHTQLGAGALFAAGATQAAPIADDGLVSERATGALVGGVQKQMVQWVLHTPPEQIAAAHAKNRLVRWDDVERIDLTWRPLSKTTRMTLRVRAGEAWTMATAGQAHVPARFAAIERALGLSAAADRVDVARRP